MFVPVFEENQGVTVFESRRMNRKGLLSQETVADKTVDGRKPFLAAADEQVQVLRPILDMNAYMGARFALLARRFQPVAGGARIIDISQHQTHSLAPCPSHDVFGSQESVPQTEVRMNVEYHC